jgi:putative inorganic carbon (HCO3(-)) transporter
MAYILYLIFIASYFLHLTARVPALGAIRFDLIMTGLVLFAIVLKRRGPKQPDFGHIQLILTIIAVYVVLSLPLVRWPGSVLIRGIPNYIKAVVFFYYTVALVDTPRKLRGFIGLFVICQLVRVFEPYYLHIAHGYWGDITTMAEGQYLLRLSGSPYDKINGNGLAFVITSVLPFLHYLSAASIWFRLFYLISLPILLHALILTASRTGLLALGAILVGIFIKSRRKILLTFVTIAAAVIAIGSLNDLQRDRFESLWSSDVRGAQTARGRLEGVWRNFSVGMQRPIFGHGLGTSLEANANLIQNAQPAHNLYAEVLEELGGIGVLLILALIAAIFVNFRHARRQLRRAPDPDPFLIRLVDAMETWFFMNVLFSFASYGLSSYEWYMFAGLSVVVRRMVPPLPKPEKQTAPQRVRGLTPELAPRPLRPAPGYRQQKPYD